jgi:hypothetical protein
MLINLNCTAMSTSINYYLKSLMIWTIIFMIAQFLPAFITGDFHNWKFYVIGSFITGTIVAAIISGILFFRLKKLGLDLNQLSKSDLKAEQSKTLNSTLSHDEVISTLENTFKNRVKIITENTLMIKTFNWYGWNKTILRLTSNSPNNTHLQITSKPIISTTLLDYGENLLMIKKLEKLLVS